MIKELFALDRGLTASQIEFLESVHKWKYNFTVRQADYIESIWYEVFGD